MSLAAERAKISRSTLDKIEKGEEGVSLGAYAKVIYILGLLHRLSELADQTHDKFGQDLDAEALPKRIRTPKKENR